MKNKIIAAGAILIVCVIILGAVFAVKENKARIPVISVKEHGMVVMPGDTVDTKDLVDVIVKGDYDYECRIVYGDDCCDMDENGVLSILDNGQTAMSTVCLECIAVGSTNRSCSERVYIDVKNPISENNSYEASASDVRFRIYNALKDNGNGVFKRGEGPADNDYEIIFHSVDSVNSVDELEEEIKRYAKEKYMLDEAASGYTSDSVVLSSGTKARKITFTTIRSEGKYLTPESSGTFVRVVIYAFGEGERYFFIEDNSPWCAEYELEQTANTVIIS